MLAALVVALFPSAPAASAEPSLQVMVTNPSYDLLAVDGSGVAYGSPVGATNEVWRSEDEGRTWTQRSTFPGNYTVFYITPLASGTLLAAVDSGEWELFRSTDGGTTWTDVLTLPITPCFYSTLTAHSVTEGDGFVFAGTYNLCPEAPNTNFIYRSADDGQSFSAIHTSTDRRHIHGVRFDPATHALFALYGDTNGAIERSLDDGVTWTPFCTTHDHCVAIDMALGDGFGIYGTDTPSQQNGIERIDLATGATERLLDLPRVSYSALGVGSGRYLVGTTYEAGAAIGDGMVHLYASNDGGQSFADVYSVPITGDHAVRLQTQFSFPNGDFPIQISDGGTIVAHLAALPPQNQALPSIGGVAQQGQTLIASAGNWSLSPTAYSYAWQRCDVSGGSCAAIGGASSPTYQLATADIGHSLRVAVTATNAGGSTSATSAHTAVVLALIKPTNVTLPSISGAAQSGQTLSASTGTWSGTAPAYNYSWLRCGPKGSGCVSIPGATAATYQLVAADMGHTLKVTIGASNGAGTATATSARTALVVGLTPPTSLTLPSISGVAQQGQTLSASTGTWSGSPTAYSYAWLRCGPKGGGCVAIVGATSSTYQVIAADVTHTLRVTVTATNGGGSTPATSNRTTLVPA